MTNHGFETQTEPYVLTGKTSNRSFFAVLLASRTTPWKKKGLVWTAVGPHGFENHDQTAFHGSLIPFEFEP